MSQRKLNSRNYFTDRGKQDRFCYSCHSGLWLTSIWDTNCSSCVFTAPLLHSNQCFDGNENITILILNRERLHFHQQNI